MAKKEKEKLPKELTRNAWVLVVGAIAPMLDSTMVNIAIKDLQLDLHTSLNMIQWAITGYVLALAVACRCVDIWSIIWMEKKCFSGRLQRLACLVCSQDLRGTLRVLLFFVRYKVLRRGSLHCS